MTGKRAFKNPPMTYGRGLNDANYVTQFKASGWTCPFFLTWKNMLKRAYSKAEHSRRPSYVGTEVCDEWLRFSTFKDWMENQDWHGKHLDKDLLVPGNKLYSPETCCFVSRELNSFLTDSAASRGDYPVGVCLHKATGKFAAQINSPGIGKRHIGLFDDADSAHTAWKNEKRAIAASIAANENNKLIANALLARFA
jgi:hypothetical protein